MSAKGYPVIADLFPGYFALVMATGIVSIACHLFELSVWASWLFYINVVAYGVLVVLNIARLVWYPSRFWADLTDFAKGPAFFTVVAGTGVLGTQVWMLYSNFPAAFSLLVAAFALWVVVMYTFFFTAIIRDAKPELDSSINGAWLIATVGTQSISVLSTLLASHSPGVKPTIMLFFALCMYLVGCMLYLLTVSIIFYRLLFFRIESKAMTPPYWILMGAVAITTLAGATLLLHADEWDFLQSLTPFLKGFTLFFWSMATWWIPLLLVLGAWRHLYKKVAFVYDPQYWGMVFPLGMYATCTFNLSKALELPFLMMIPRVFLFIAVATWMVTFCSMIYEIVRSFFKRPAGVS